MLEVRRYILLERDKHIKRKRSTDRRHSTHNAIIFTFKWQNIKCRGQPALSLSKFFVTAIYLCSVAWSALECNEMMLTDERERQSDSSYTDLSRRWCICIRWLTMSSMHRFIIISKKTLMLPGEGKKCLEEDADWFMSTGRFLLVFLVTKKKSAKCDLCSSINIIN